MDIMTIDVQTRDSHLKGKDLRVQKLLPAEFYGRGVKNISLQLGSGEFRRLYRTAGRNTVIELNVDGKQKHNALVHDLQYDPISDEIIHVDFINVRMDEMIHAKIPLKFIGVAPAVKELSGILTYNLDEIDVKCLPKDLIHSIEVSVEGIVNFHSYVRVKDLAVPASITILNPPDEVVVTAVAPKEEEEVAPVAAVAADATAAAVPGAPAADAAAATPASSSTPAAAAPAAKAKK
ncbi:50S ribosomal protein L25 [Candidatus Peregrinibacteria bacterium]|nr:50S ribosomal protein L25 [Candidatus Peregrinibacteria bacterium]